MLPRFDTNGVLHACSSYLVAATPHPATQLLLIPDCHRVRYCYMAPAIMCFGRKATPDPTSKNNEEIEKNLRLDKKKAEREVKLLLLGMLQRRRARV